MYIGTTINESPVIAEVTGAAITGGSFKAVKYDGSGKIVLCSAAGEKVAGFLPGQTPDLASGDDVTVQISAMGKALTGAAVAKGDLLTTDANGNVVPAVDGQYVAAVAVDAASAANKIIAIRITGGAHNEANGVTLAAGAALTSAAKLIAKASTGKAVVASVSGEAVLGVFDENTPAAVASDANVGVVISGRCNVIAGAAVAVGAMVMTDASAKAITATAGNYIFGIALTAATAANDVIEVLLTGGGYAPAA